MASNAYRHLHALSFAYFFVCQCSFCTHHSGGIGFQECSMGTIISPSQRGVRLDHACLPFCVVRMWKMWNECDMKYMMKYMHMSTTHRHGCKEGENVCEQSGNKEQQRMKCINLVPFWVRGDVKMAPLPRMSRIWVWVLKNRSTSANLISTRRLNCSCGRYPTRRRTYVHTNGNVCFTQHDEHNNKGETQMKELNRWPWRMYTCMPTYANLIATRRLFGERTRILNTVRTRPLLSANLHTMSKTKKNGTIGCSNKQEQREVHRAIWTKLW